MATLKEVLRSRKVNSCLPTKSGNGINFYAGELLVGTVNNIQFESELQWVKDHAEFNCNESGQYLTVSEPVKRTALDFLFEDEPAAKGKKVKA